VALVVYLHTFWDWSGVCLVGPFVGHVAGLSGSGLEVAVSVFGSVWACPHPASVGLWSG
jgi:hypothetical protein